jgi:hypothetical protein
MEAVGDGGGTTKTQVTLEVQLQLITEIKPPPALFELQPPRSIIKSIH